MALPEQIRKQTEAVQELYKELNGEPGTGGDTPPTDTVPPTEQPTTVPPADDTSAPNDATQPSGTEQTPNGAANPEDDPNSETYAQKWRTLQGMYNAEVPRLHSQNRELNARVQQMEQLLSTMSAQQPQTAALPSEPVVTDADKEEYGESLDVMRRVTREELIPVAQKIAQIEKVLQALQTNVVPQVQNIAQRQARTAEQQFWDDLATAVPNWRDVNENADFQTWLLDIDPLTGISRQTYLEDAQRNLDVRRVANFFKTWNELTGAAAVAQPTNRAAPAATTELQRQVAPGKSRNTGAPQSGNAKTYSPEDIKKFFADVRQGKYKGREQERDRLERDIFAAQREGRIIA